MPQVAFSRKLVFEILLQQIKASCYSVRLGHSLPDDEFSVTYVFGVNMVNIVTKRHKGHLHGAPCSPRTRDNRGRQRQTQLPHTQAAQEVGDARGGFLGPFL